MGQDEGDTRTTLWFHNKGWHVLPAYLNVLSNVALGLNSSNSTVRGKGRAGQGVCMAGVEM